jgi:hypothetical protein
LEYPVLVSVVGPLDIDSGSEPVSAKQLALTDGSHIPNTYDND